MGCPIHGILISHQNNLSLVVSNCTEFFFFVVVYLFWGKFYICQNTLIVICIMWVLTDRFTLIEDTELFHLPRKFPSLLVPYNFHQVATTLLNFNCGLVLGFWKFHVNGILPYVLFGIWILLLRICLWDPSLWLNVWILPFCCWLAYCFINILQFVHSYVDERLGCF